MQNFFKNKFTIFIAFVILFLTGSMLYSLTANKSTVTDSTAGTIASPAQQGFGSIGSFFSSIVERLTKYDDVLKENEELKKQISGYDSSSAQNEMYKTENEDLKELLNLKEQNTDFVFEDATVISKDPGDWFSVFTIDKGSINGIKTGCPVITSDGLAGIIKSVGLNYAKVVSIIDTECVTGAMIARTGDAAIAEGNFELSQSGLCKLTFFDNNVIINRGDIVDTSGLGGVFPKGLRIGRIEDILPEEGGITNYAVIRPAVNFDSIKKVYVIKSFNSDEEGNSSETVSK